MADLCKYKLLSPDSAESGKDLVAGKNAEDGLRRIQALLAEWLRMENVVVLTAAGCSVGAGGRLMGSTADNNLECLVLDAVEQCKLSDDAKAIIEWRKANGFGKGNFEEWLSFLFNANGLVKADQTPIHSVTWKRKPVGDGNDEFTLTPDDEEILRKYIENALSCSEFLDSDQGKAIIGWKKENGFGDDNFEDLLDFLFNVTDLAKAEQTPIPTDTDKRESAGQGDEELVLTPDSKEMLRKYIEYALRYSDIPISDPGKEIIEWREEKGFGDDNIEKWLSFLFNVTGLAASEGYEKLVLTSDDEEILRKYIEKAIYSECALQLDRSELTGEAETTSGHIPFLAKLIARDSNLGRTHLFTLNFDTLFEQALEELGIQYFDGFSGKTSARFDPAVYGLDVYYPGDIAEGRVRRFDKFLQFYKLHGSLHWFVEDGIYRAQHKDLSFAKEYRDSNVEAKSSWLQSSEYEKIRSFGILPTSQKFSQTLDMPFAHLFRLFHARLNQPQTFLMVLGYGFGDDHVTRIIETALTNPSLVMLVVEPDPHSKVIDRIKRYQNLGQRVFILTENLENDDKKDWKNSNIATFADFSQNVMPDVKWLEDFKRLRKFEEQIRKSEDKEPK